MHDPVSSSTLTLSLREPGDIARIDAWRERDVPDDIIAVCAAFRCIDRIVARSRDRYPHAFIASMPHAGGEWLRDAMSAAAGIDAVSMTTGGADDEPDLARARLPEVLAGSSIAHHESRATESNVDLLARLGARPIVLVRSIPTVLELVARSLDGRAGSPAFAVLPADVSRWTYVERLELVVHTLGPRLLSFHASWEEAEALLPVFRLDHGVLVSDPVGCLGAALAHIGVERSAGRLEAIVRSLGPPSGEQIDGEFPAPLRAALEELASFFAPDHELDVLGL